MLTFSDQDKAIEVHPAKGAPVTIPYGQIDKCAYEYTNGLMGETETLAEIHYHDQDAPKVSSCTWTATITCEFWMR